MSATIQIVLSTLFVAMWVLCASAPEAGSGSPSEPCPAGIQIHYEWTGGALPPPYHYEYSIDIRASGEGRIVMVPDYPSERAPVWTEVFAVDPGSLKKLCDKMKAEGLWSETWKTMEHTLLGGSSESLKAEGGGLAVTIPAFPVAHQKKRAEAIYGAIKALVPESLWSELEARRKEYQERHSTR
ncbi:MAG: hypothetical protein AB9873_06520 [Syntrophobacteraceae bacterium]